MSDEFINREDFRLHFIIKSFSATFSGLPADSSLFNIVSISSAENGWMSSGLKLEHRKASAKRVREREINHQAHRTTFPRLMKRIRSIATAAYVHAT